MIEQIEGIKIQFDFGEVSYDGHFISFEQDWDDGAWHIGETGFVKTSDEMLYKSFITIFPEVDYEDFLVMVRAVEKGILLCN